MQETSGEEPSTDIENSIEDSAEVFESSIFTFAKCISFYFGDGWLSGWSAG
jgi:hypothetical protein